MSRPRILAVDDSFANLELIEAYLQQLDCEVERALDGERALALAAARPPDLVLLDVQMPGLDGIEVCRRIKLAERTKLVPVVMVTALAAVEDRVQALEAGADDFLSKPVDRAELVARVRSLLRVKGLYDNLADTRHVIQALAQAVEAKDRYTEQHTERVAASARALAAAAGLGPGDLDEVYFGASIHDIGKIGVPDAILLKPGALTAEEMAVMRRHPVIGADIVSSLTASRTLVDIVRHHHEAIDGQGYPDGLADEEIPLAARIVAICDAYDALVSDRPYRSRLLERAAVHTLRAGAGRQWDAHLLELFITRILAPDARLPAGVAGS